MYFALFHLTQGVFITESTGFHMTLTFFNRQGRKRKLSKANDFSVLQLQVSFFVLPTGGLDQTVKLNASQQYFTIIFTKKIKHQTYAHYRGSAPGGKSAPSCNPHEAFFLILQRHTLVLREVEDMNDCGCFTHFLSDRNKLPIGQTYSNNPKVKVDEEYTN